MIHATFRSISNRGLQAGGYPTNPDFEAGGYPRTSTFITAAITAAMLILFSSCFRCKPPLLIDNGRIPDSILSCVPYQQGQTLKFRHSGGLVIGFSSTRQSRDEWLRCDWCCDYEYKFEVNTTTLTPDYPIFSLGFDLSNPDSKGFDFGARVGYYWFQIPSNSYQAAYCGYADSLMIGEKKYYKVFKIKSNYGSSYDRDTIFADSMYYSYKQGLIQIMMSNGEKYSIDE
jgi:hypothetical protein